MPNKAATAPAAGKAVLRMYTTLTSIADQPCLVMSIPNRLGIPCTKKAGTSYD